jgi:hypothetical protein
MHYTSNINKALIKVEILCLESNENFQNALVRCLDSKQGSQAQSCRKENVRHQIDEWALE